MIPSLILDVDNVARLLDAAATQVPGLPTVFARHTFPLSAYVEFSLSTSHLEDPQAPLVLSPSPPDGPSVTVDSAGVQTIFKSISRRQLRADHPGVAADKLPLLGAFSLPVAVYAGVHPDAPEEARVVIEMGLRERVGSREGELPDGCFVSYRALNEVRVPGATVALALKSTAGDADPMKTTLSLALLTSNLRQIKVLTALMDVLRAQPMANPDPRTVLIAGVGKESLAPHALLVDGEKVPVSEIWAFDVTHPESLDFRWTVLGYGKEVDGMAREVQAAPGFGRYLTYTPAKVAVHALQATGAIAMYAGSTDEQGHRVQLINPKVPMQLLVI